MKRNRFRLAGALALVFLALVIGIAALRPDTSAPAPLATTPRPVRLVAAAPVDSAALRAAAEARAKSDSIAREREREEERKREAEQRRNGPRLEISLEERRLWWLEGKDTLFSAPVAVGKGTELEWDGRNWKFETPRGERTVLAKSRDPVWVPPLWHFVEAARTTDRKLVVLEPGQEVELFDGSNLVFRGDTVGQLLLPDSVFLAHPPGQEIVFDETVFVPPVNTVNRRVVGELGKYKLDMGNGYLLHGTRDSTSIGSAATHGCIRLGDADLQFLYEKIPVGTPVFIR